MTEPLDEQFYDRADAHIALANQQSLTTGKGKVSASFLYAAARFNAYVGAFNSGSLQKMTEDTEHMVAYYLKQYEAMLRENLDDYQKHYDKYMVAPKQ